MGLLRFFRRRILKRHKFPPAWLDILERNAKFLRNLSAARRKEFLARIQIFLSEKQFIPAGGMTITDEVRVVVAACAMRLIVGLDLSYYDRLTEIVVYPGDYKRPGEDDEMLGEAQDWGVIVLSWESVLKGIRGEDDGINTAIHEFAHVLDRADGVFDGTPRLRSRKHYSSWRKIMSRNFEALRERRSPQIDVLDDYGAESEAEFFAVCTETFFERPGVLKKSLPDLYAELRRFFGIDPA